MISFCADSLRLTLGIITRLPPKYVPDILGVRILDLTLEYDVTFSPPKEPIPHSIAEIRMDVYDRSNLLEDQYAAERLVSILILFKAWPVYWTSYSIIFPTITPFCTVHTFPYPELGIKTKVIEPSDEECLDKLYQALLQILPKEMIYKSGKYFC